MRKRQLIRSGTIFAWRAYVAVGLSVLVGTAALAGALLVGDSMRGSLRDQALERLGPVDFAMRSPRFLRREVVDALADDDAIRDSALGVCGVIEMSAGIEHATKKTRSNDVRVFGVDASLTSVFDDASAVRDIGSGGIVVSRALADSIDAQEGDDVLLRLTQAGPIPAESILGRPEDLTTSLRLTIERVIERKGVGGFSLDVSQWAPRNAFVSLSRLQKAIGQVGRVNTVLVRGNGAKDHSPDASVAIIQQAFGTHVGLEDYSLQLRRDAGLGVVALASEQLLIDPAAENAAMHAAAELKASASGTLTYLANSIDALDSNGNVVAGRRIPYSIVCGLDLASHTRAMGNATAMKALETDEIALGAWAAEDLGVSIGDRVSMKYYVSGRFGTLDERSHTFRVAQIVPMKSWAADRGLMPPYPGIADADSLADWDPPPSYKIDLSRIRDKDEDYWREFRGTPKAFVALATAQTLWAGDERRFGDVTSVYLSTPDGMSLEQADSAIRDAIMASLPPDKMGMMFTAAKRDALRAGAGSTDFSGLFIAFSFFVILSAAILVALSFRLATEKRSGQVGLLMAVGFTRRDVGRVFLGEGAIVAGLGAILGLPTGVGYAWLMLTGLRTWWSDAVNAPFLTLHVTPLSLSIGFVGGFFVAIFSVWIALRGMTRKSPRGLLAGALRDDAFGQAGRQRAARLTFALSILIGIGATIAALGSDSVPRVPAFFAAGGGLLIAGLAAMALWLGRATGGEAISAGAGAMMRLGMRNAKRQRSRSVMTTSLIACATFVVVAVGANRHRAGEDAQSKSGGSGGFALIAKSSTALPFDLNSTSGREQLGVTVDTARALDKATTMSLRRMRGDDSSCLNLYQVKRPEILGVPNEWIGRGGFAFARSAAESDAAHANPWTLLEGSYDDGAIPAIGDMNTLMWLLKLGINDDMPIIDERGRETKLRIVGMLSGSILQSQLIVAEDRFVEMFPSTSGYGVVLIGGARDGVDALSSADIKALSDGLENDLSSYGFDAEPTLDVLNRYRAIENTYMSAFQALGGLGLAIGTIGLAAVMLRNVVERRSELALLRALGYSPRMLGMMVLAENAALLVIGLGIGTVSALIAAGPNIVSTGALVAWGELCATLAIVALVGLLSGVLAVNAAVRAPLVTALRSE